MHSPGINGERELWDNRLTQVHLDKMAIKTECMRVCVLITTTTTTLLGLLKKWQLFHFNQDSEKHFSTRKTAATVTCCIWAAVYQLNTIRYSTSRPHVVQHY